MTPHMLKRVEIIGFKSFAKKTILDFSASVTSIVGPNGSGKSNVAEAFRFALGEQSMKSMRGKRSEDLIFSGSPTAPRTNRAAVAIIFNNTSRVFDLDFDEVRVERAVLRDGTSEYTINDSRVRLRDIHKMLSNANIGESGHHIIAQGEADRILLADARKRREMLEDALGLASYEFKKLEAQRKLERTRENMVQVEAMRRELTPRVHFLQKQVEKLERADATRDELCVIGAEYFAIEDAYLVKETKEATTARANAKEKFITLSSELDAISARVDSDDEGDRRVRTVRAAEEALERVTTAYNVLVREIGRTEGAIEVMSTGNSAHEDSPYVQILQEDIKTLLEEIRTQVQDASNGDIQKLRTALLSIRTVVRSFFKHFGSKDEEVFLTGEQQKLHALEHEREEQKKKEKVFCDDVEKARNAVMRAREMSVAHQEAGREGQRHNIELAQAKVYAQTAVAREDARLSALTQRSERCEHKKAELLALVGSPVVSYAPRADVSQEEYAEQNKRGTTIDRLVIRLEEIGGTGEDIRKEYKDVFERESFLARELADLSHSADALRTLIDDIDEEVAKSFAQGLERVNESFSVFFSLMFNGGSARLVFEEDSALDEDDDEDVSENNLRDTSARRKLGIDVIVHIQKKKVQSLLQLSGGERALVSIALIFAMSQVNPPPFLILDETDAALDEANSRRYGDMIENLAKQSQLIVITHNRETMSRAGILYGVTMRDDGISRLLSVKFDEETVTAKR